ncbi:MAG: DEAD/DEAH box helicase [Planctomycetota bacterium]
MSDNPFQSFGLHPQLEKAVIALGYKTPTPIQKQAIPFAIKGRDVLACAATGSGKTAAFLLPTLDYLLDENRPGPRVLVVTPTRELAAQVADDMKDLARYTKLRGAAIYGGVGMGAQADAFRNGVDVLVATPGRLLDHLTRPYASLSRVEVLILDEADRMLDMGFLPDVRRILLQVPEDRQTLLFSATMPPQIAKLAKEMLYEPERIAVERKQAPAKGVRQKMISVSQPDKQTLLLDILDDRNDDSVLVFTRTKSRANRLTLFLTTNGINAERIHGNRSQSQREKALSGFKTGRIRVLVATDIAARGIDVDNLSLVVNFDCPNLAEDYIHRVGRTARAEKQGDAITFVSSDERSHLATIEKALGNRIEQSNPPATKRRSVKTAPRRQRQRAGGERSGGRSRSPGQGEDSRSGSRRGTRDSKAPSKGRSKVSKRGKANARRRSRS